MRPEPLVDAPVMEEVHARGQLLHHLLGPDLGEAHRALVALSAAAAQLLVLVHGQAGDGRPAPAEAQSWMTDPPLDLAGVGVAT